MNLSLKAMQFAREAHCHQLRRYTGNPYSDHLAEVAGIAATVAMMPMMTKQGADIMIATAWLHDCVEDCQIAESTLIAEFGEIVTSGVMLLSDLEIGNRAERKAASRARLATAPSWVQSIKVADLISNTSSIVMHDPKFAVTYLDEKRLLLDVLKLADPSLVSIARAQTAA